MKLVLFLSKAYEKFLVIVQYYTCSITTHNYGGRKFGNNDNSFVFIPVVVIFMKHDQIRNRKIYSVISFEVVNIFSNR
jgi:hypothetical protein